VLEPGIVTWIKMLPALEPERRDPVSIVALNLIRKLEEGTPIGWGLNSPRFDRCCSTPP